MSTAKIVLRKIKLKDGKYPLAIQIIKNRKPVWIHVRRSIDEKDWDAVKQRVRKTHPNSARFNNFLLKKLTEANDKLFELEGENKDVSAKAIGTSIKRKKGLLFFSQAQLYLDTLKARGSYNRYAADAPRIDRMREFVKDRELSFQEIDVPFLNQFSTYLKSTRNISDRTIINHLVVIRTIFSQAIKAGLVDAKHYPFGDGKIQIKYPQSNKIGLTSEEIAILENFELPSDSPLLHARNIFLFSFYFAGMRVSDILRLRWCDIQNERLHYTMGKNAKAGSLKVSDKAMNIINTYKSQKRSSEDVIFPQLKTIKDFNNTFEVQRKIALAVKTINKYLEKLREAAQIEKPITMHIARHTFGNISGDKISIQMLQKLYRHSSITTTVGYQANFIHKDADDALDAVLNDK
ncbi:MAG: site-specific integrase [Bacteroidia bacterium]